MRKERLRTLVQSRFKAIERLEWRARRNREGQLRGLGFFIRPKQRGALAAKRARLLQAVLCAAFPPEARDAAVRRARDGVIEGQIGFHEVGGTE